MKSALSDVVSLVKGKQWSNSEEIGESRSMGRLDGPDISGCWDIEKINVPK